MKKVFSVLATFICVVLFSCSSDSTDYIDNSTEVKKLARVGEKEGNTIIQGDNVTNGLAAGICPDGYTPVFRLSTKVTAFKSFTACSKLFGFCFFKATLVFDCVKINSPVIYEFTSYDPVKDEADSYFEVIDGTTIRFWVPSDIVNSPSKVASDFDYFDVGNYQLTPNYTLTAGIYAQHVTSSGDHFYYDIPYTYVP